MTRGGTSKNDTDYTDELINKVCTSFSNKLEARIDKKLDRLESKLDAKLNELNNSIKDLGNISSSNAIAIKVVEQKCDSMEQYSKRNALRIVGFPERESENILDDVITFISSKLNISCRVNDFDCVFRVGNLKEQGKARPRPILVQFISNIKRDEVYVAKKLLKGTDITIYEDLTTTRYTLLSAAKKKYGNKNAWSSGGKIFVWSAEENKRRQISSGTDL